MALPVVTVDAFGCCPLHGIPVQPNSICPDCIADKPPIVSSRRLNVGCGDYPLLHYVNLDASPAVHADIHQTVPPLPFDDGALDDIYAGHFFEHLTQEEADDFLAECFRCLVPGGRLGIVVPDTREVMTRWLAGSVDAVEYGADIWHPIADLDAVCRLFLYSTVQDTHHKWSYDVGTLARRLEAAGFEIVGEIDRYRDPRIARGVWYQCGLDSRKPA